jgi:hypothetical protein
MDRDEMINVNRGLPIDASYQLSFHLNELFQRRRLLVIHQNRENNCLWRPCFLMDQDAISSGYRGSSIDASYQVSVHLAKLFQRRFLEID